MEGTDRSEGAVVHFTSVDECGTLSDYEIDDAIKKSPGLLDKFKADYFQDGFARVKIPSVLMRHLRLSPEDFSAMVNFILAGANFDPSLTFPVILRLSKSGETVGDPARCATVCNPSVLARSLAGPHPTKYPAGFKCLTRHGIFTVPRHPCTCLKSLRSPSCVNS